MKHNCPFCGHDLNGTELGNHINDLEGKVASPEPDPMVAQLHAEMEALKALIPQSKPPSLSTWRGSNPPLVPEPDPMVAQLHAEMEALKALIPQSKPPSLSTWRGSNPPLVPEPATPLDLPHFGN